ncbi:MAG: hypothetical protein KDK36_01335 [Leptospiraceae bacterium]|nr:hypothetical protein [Leptospiraceae bacterium]
MEKYLLPIQIFSCFFMTGLIWLIQLIHYPAYKYIAEDYFSIYQNFHTKTITYIVFPLMSFESVSGFILIFLIPISSFFFLLNFIGIISIWLVTGLLSVPAHNKLNSGKNFKVIKKLILSNWLRTIIWSIRSLFFIIFLIDKL